MSQYKTVYKKRPKITSYKININMIQRKKRLVTDSDVDVSRKESSQLQLTHEKKNIWFFKFRLINLSQNSKTN